MFNWNDITFEVNSYRNIKLNYSLNDSKPWYDYSDNNLTYDTLVTFLKKNPNIKIEIRWYLWVGGNNELYIAITRHSAEFAKGELISKGINPERIKAVGMGGKQPIYTDDYICNLKTKEEKEAAFNANFRVEIFIIE